MSKTESSKPRPHAEKQGATLFMQALDHFRKGRFQSANDLLVPALRSEPNNAQLWQLAGNAAKGLGQLNAAEQCWRTALALNPDYAEAHYNLGVMLQEQNRLVEAATHYQAALAKPGWHPRALNNLGVVLMKGAQPEKAEQCFGDAIGLDPAYGKAHHNRGRALVALGRFEQARQAFESALKHSPENGRAHIYRSLSAVKRFVPGDMDLADMESLERRSGTLSESDRMDLHFALGKAYDDLGEHARSFRHFLAGNRDKRKQVPYDETGTLARLDRIRAAYSPELMAARAGRGCPSEVPVFIVGMPRSGSTLVEQILASHPEVHGAGESEEFRQMAEAIVLPDGSKLYPDGIARLPDDALPALGQRYVDAMRKLAPDAKRIADKNLINIQHVGLIHLALPSAKIINTVRDPVETCLSCFVRIFQGEHFYTYDLAELGRYWQAQDRLMAHWRRILPAGVLIEVSNENLVADLEGQTRRMLEHCGLEWNANCLDFHKTERPIYTASAMQVRQPIFNAPVKKSQFYGDLLQPLLSVLAG